MAKAAIQKIMDEYQAKMKSGDAKGAQVFVCDDVKVLPSHHAAVSGKTEMEKFHQMAKEKMPKGFELKFTVGEVVEIGDVAIADGITVVTIDGKEVDNGKFLTIYKKVEGEYKLLRSMMNTSKPREGAQ